MAKTIPEISAEALTLVDELGKVGIGGVVAYKHLSDLIRSDVQKKARGSLNTARRKLQREAGILFEPIRGVGLARMSDSGIASASHSYVDKCKRVAMRNERKMECVKEFDKLAPNEKHTWLTNMTLLKFYGTVSTRKNIKRIGSAVAVVQKELPLQATLALFAQNGEANTT